MEVTNNLNKMSYPLALSFMLDSDIEGALQDNRVKQIVDSYAGSNKLISVAETMANLSQVGYLLKTAYAGTKGHKGCSDAVLKIMNPYQSLLKNSRVITGEFVDATLKALQMHKMAIEWTEKGKTSTALGFLQKCAGLAKTMADVSGKLVEESSTLCKMSAEALIQVTISENISQEQRKSIQQSMSNFKTKQAKLEQATKDLIRDVKEEQEKEKEAAKEVRRAQNLSTFVTIAGAVALPLLAAASPVTALTATTVWAMKKKKDANTNNNPDENAQNLLKNISDEGGKLQKDLVKAKGDLAAKEEELKQKTDPQESAAHKIEIARLKSNIDTIENSLKERRIDLQKVQETFKQREETAIQKEGKIAERRAVLQKDLRESNADLAESVAKLRSLKEDDDTLNTAIISLEMTIKLLGRVKTVFENTRLFWMDVEKQCKNLSDVSLLEMIADEKEAFIEGTKDSGLRWLVLARDCKKARDAIQVVDKKFDGTMEDLPTSEEAKQLIQNVRTQGLVLDRIITEENKILNN